MDLEHEVALRRISNRRRGLDLAWSNSNEYVSLKKGYPMMIAGLGGVGKTELIFDIIINSAIMHGWKWLLLSPETGSAEEIIEQILEKVSRGKVLETESQNRMGDKEFKDLVAWSHKHFRILDPMRNWKQNFEDLALNIENLFRAVQHEEKRLRGKFDGILIDPFNELDIDLGGGKTMSSVKNELDALLWWTKRNDYLTILSNHVNDRPELRHKINERAILWTPPARKEDWAFGQQFGRKGYQMILVYEPHHSMQEEKAELGDFSTRHSVENNFNLREIYVQKSKPKGVGKTGKFNLFYNRKLQRYYELDSLGCPKSIKWPLL